jgi:hypothetical protein
MISGWLGCAVDDLAIVVLTHELAHAYTQLGADIDGRRWAAASFAKAETELKEGLRRVEIQDSHLSLLVIQAPDGSIRFD